MPVELMITPHGRATVDPSSQPNNEPPDPLTKRVTAAFAMGDAHGLLHLATTELTSHLPPGLAFGRNLARVYLTKLCHTPGLDEAMPPPVAPPDAAELSDLVVKVPAIKGGEYLTNDVLLYWWEGLDALVRKQISQTSGGAAAFLKEQNPVWRMVGRVTFHLAENKADANFPFAFLATYAGKMSGRARVVHQPLANALQEYAGGKNRQALLALLTPVQRAADRLPWVKELVDSQDVYHPLAWSPKDAYQFLKDVPALEEAGLVVHVPDWWRAARPPRPVVNVTVGSKESRLGADAVLDFSVGVTVDGSAVSDEELAAIRESTGGLVLLKNKWVEVDKDKLDQALSHWKEVESQARDGGVSFFEGMRLMSGATLDSDAAATPARQDREWTGIHADAVLEKTLAELREPSTIRGGPPPGLNAELRPYQLTGVNWLRFMTRLSLGACLADDMGLGKTIQILSLLLHIKERFGNERTFPSLLVIPASLIGNWKAEAEKFAPTLKVHYAHPSENKVDTEPDLAGVDLVITTYGMLTRTEWIKKRTWRIAILDEAQAIKNSGTRQTKAVKDLDASSRVALTGTPVENRPSDLWSLFDFLNPGLLGTAKQFSSFLKKASDDDDKNPYGPLRTLVRPYILRRLKTDKKIIADLPDKTEVTAFCGLTARQIALYEQVVESLQSGLKSSDGIKRKGIVLAALTRLKQVCNHPSQWTGDNAFDPVQSGKFHRLREIATELNDRQEKVLVFTQFREMTGPLADFLATVFGRPGLVLSGQTAVSARRNLVEDFQRDDGPPFFVLSIKAGGTGLNLTQASQVIHFDRWWNPAVENQATDRAFRIGQKRNVLVHKFVCRGTVEEKIDQMIKDKIGLAKDLLDGEGESLLTEMTDDQLIRMVSLDVTKAADAV
jgi:non-specific serine/threonine protein kinase